MVDTSAVLACCLGEAGFEQFESILTSSLKPMMSAASRLELGIVAMNRHIQPRVDEAHQTYQIQIEPYTQAQAEMAKAAFAQYGKGRHPAALNFGDCCAYALAKSMNLPLLYKGNDFAQTDITSALA